MVINRYVVRSDTDELVDVGDDLLLPAKFSVDVPRGNLGGDGPIGVDLTLDVEWNQAQFRYELLSLKVTTEQGGTPISGTVMRSLPLQKILRGVVAFQLQRRVYLGEGAPRPETSVPALEFGLRSYQDSKADYTVLGAFGPRPETLTAVAQVHRSARILLDPPTQAVADAFGVPHRTASHWIKLARERGHLKEESVSG